LVFDAPWLKKNCFLHRVHFEYPEPSSSRVNQVLLRGLLREKLFHHGRMARSCTLRVAPRMPTVIVAVNYARVPKKRPKLNAKNNASAPAIVAITRPCC
jgi:hypothetical protein